MCPPEVVFCTEYHPALVVKYKVLGIYSLHYLSLVVGTGLSGVRGVGGVAREGQLKSDEHWNPKVVGHFPRYNLRLL